MSEQIPYAPRSQDEAARTELAALLGKHYGTSAGGDDHLWAMADILIERGWRKAQPLWTEYGDNDGEYEYTTTSDCDGSSLAHFRRKPRFAYLSDYSSWEPYTPEVTA